MTDDWSQDWGVQTLYLLFRFLGLSGNTSHVEAPT